MKVADIAKTIISFKREIPLPFAFTCLKFELDEAGRIIRMPPAREMPTFDASTEYEKESLSDAVALIDLD